MIKILLALGGVSILVSCNDSKDRQIKHALIPVMQMASPAGDSCAEPFLFTDKNDVVYMSWIEKRGRQSILYFSALRDEKWSAPKLIASGNNWFVNWADYPVIASDGNNNLLAHYLEKSDTGKFTYDIRLVSSADAGYTWNQSGMLNEDNVKAEHGFVSIIPYQNGFFAAWLDGRKTVSEANNAGHGHHGEMTLRGAMLDHKGNKREEWELDSRICDCCQTSVAITREGPVVVYRDRSNEEVRDIFVVRYVNGEWSAPQTIFADNWKIKACPVNGPRVSSAGNNLAVAWFSMQDKKGEVKLVFSRDGGATFEKPIRMDAGNTIGRVDVQMIDSTSAFVTWMEAGSIRAARVHANGVKEDSILVASSSEKRSSGFPQMTASGKKLIFAWTDDEAKSIKIGTIDL